MVLVVQGEEGLWYIVTNEDDESWVVSFLRIRDKCLWRVSVTLWPSGQVFWT